jgi:DNA topoisomerase-3
VSRAKKNIVSTATGRALIKGLPAVATTPDMTAVWEAAMRSITDGEQTLDAFLSRVNGQLQQLIDQGRALGQVTVPSASSIPPSAARMTTPSAGNGKKKTGTRKGLRPAS